MDQIAITVGNQAITQTEITRDIRLAALLNGDSPNYGTDARRAAADRLVEQALIRREMTFGNYPPTPPAQLDEAVAKTEQARGGAAKAEKLLAQYNLSKDDLRSYLGWQISLLKFIDLRFRPAVQVTEEDVETYYRENVATAATGRVKAESLHDMHNKIEEKLTGERVDKQLDDWIKRAKGRTMIRYLDASLGSTPAAPLRPETAQPH